MKKVVVILIVIVMLVGIVSAVAARSADTGSGGNVQYASNYKSHGQLGNGHVNQEFKGGFIDPWDCPPQHGEVCWP